MGQPLGQRWNPTEGQMEPPDSAIWGIKVVAGACALPVSPEHGVGTGLTWGHRTVKSLLTHSHSVPSELRDKEGAPCSKSQVLLQVLAWVTADPVSAWAGSTH